jgi:frataxin-like iron-binding protein CyaY
VEHTNTTEESDRVLVVEFTVVPFPLFKKQEPVHKIWVKVECAEYHVTAVSLRHYERNRLNARFLFL